MKLNTKEEILKATSTEKFKTHSLEIKKAQRNLKLAWLRLKEDFKLPDEFTWGMDDNGDIVPFDAIEDIPIIYLSDIK